MSLQERTLVLRNFDAEKTTKELVTELFIQAGPVKNVVIRPDHAFVEFEDIESVGYSKALLDGVEMFGKKLELQPKARLASQMKYVKLLNDYIAYDRRCKEQQTLQQQQIAFYQQHQQNPQPFVTPQFQPPVQTIPPPAVYQPRPVAPPGPIYPAQATVNPGLFTLNPLAQPSQYLPPNPWAQQQPASSQSGPANSMRRSWSFNDKSSGYSGNFNRNHQLRNSERRR